MASPEDTPKGQHFLLSPECRTLTVLDLAKMRDTTAYNWFKRLRWHETEGEPYCPKCGTLRCHTMSRNRFKCTEKTCKAVFSVTSGTVFHARKLSFKKMLIAIWLSANSVKGKAALQLSREIGVQYKTAWVLLMKLREAIAWRREEMVLDGQVEIDGKYAGGHIRPENKTEDRIDRRLKKYQNMKRLCALAIRQRGLGAQTFTRIIRDEDGDAAWAAVRDHVSREATVFADEHGSYNDLAGLNKLQRVNHSKAYQTDDGTNTNQVESFFSRVQRAYARLGEAAFGISPGYAEIWATLRTLTDERMADLVARAEALVAKEKEAAGLKVTIGYEECSTNAAMRKRQSSRWNAPWTRRASATITARACCR